MNDKNKDSKFLDVIYQNAEDQKAQLREDIKNYKKKKLKTPAKQNIAIDTSKESKFFEAINQDAAAHMAQITQEIEAYRNEKIEQATEQGLQDAYDLIRADLTKRTAAIVNGVAKKELDLRDGLFLERQTIRDEVFAQAREKLTAFAQTEDYTQFLSKSLSEIAQTAGSDQCIVSVAPADENKRDMIQSQLPEAQIVVDNHILIGGMKAHIPAQGIMLDDTLDTRLSDQYAWFNENSGLKVV